MKKERIEKKMREIVKKYRNIPYKHNGRSLTGLDCLGLTIAIYKEFGIKLPSNDGAYVSEEWYKEDPDRYLNGLLKIGKPIGSEDLQVLDLVYFELLDGIVTHSGIMINDHEFIHILQKRDVEVSRFNRFWRKKYAGARRLI
ncbi:C40 family peptidase [Orenia marismortui]|uniref:NlpC/P60 family protein n=1 Tax=Orenia marismortui TaxID=46469 RepID=A0A4R8GRD8_9FIRM|nr:NlpC/P60 family protein [Orenia marismortui]TDX48433.1 NlpC/P60 family protein [Orenia marismortui]